MEAAADNFVFTLDETFEQLTAAAESRADDVAAFDALKLHLASVRESGLVAQAFQAAEMMGALCLGHAHAEMQQRSLEQSAHERMAENRHSPSTDKKKKKKKSKKKSVPTNRGDGSRPAKSPKIAPKKRKNALGM